MIYNQELLEIFKEHAELSKKQTAAFFADVLKTLPDDISGKCITNGYIFENAVYPSFKDCHDTTYRAPSNELYEAISSCTIYPMNFSTVFSSITINDEGHLILNGYIKIPSWAVERISINGVVLPMALNPALSDLNIDCISLLLEGSNNA